MTQRRQRLADFEARSVQLIAACTLGLAGMASVPASHAARITGHAISLTGAPGNTKPGPVRVDHAPTAQAQTGKSRS